ncbi:MAG: 50S ribosome-binding GTPase [Candidatus Aenigmarchaeota archaeon]|nr:50S ribosome-binding GTPase [Candidatus Aenigmarchaeota archaeon]
MPNFWKIVNDTIHEADILLLLLDARLVEETRHEEIEEKVREEGKVLIYVVTKSDLVKKESAEKWKRKLHPCVFVSAKERLGTTILRETILMEAKRKGIVREPLIVGVLGYPNVGKSSLINALSGRSAASTSILSGHTRGSQKIRMDNRITILDTPGVIPMGDKDRVKQTIIGTVDFTKSKAPDMVCMELMRMFPGKIERYYGVEASDDKEKTIEDVAIKGKMMKKGGFPDIDRAARKIIKDWQSGKIK